MAGGDGGAVKARSDLLYRELADGAMLYDARSQQVHHLNETAALVWAACARGEAMDQIVAVLCQRYEASVTQARADVQALVGRFGDLDLLLP